MTTTTTTTMTTRIRDYTPYLSRISARRQPSAIRSLQPLIQIPGMISLGGGLPNPAMFPFNKVTIDLKTGEKIELDGDALDRALQYSPSYGISELVKWLKEFTVIEHNPPYPSPNDWQCCVFSGSQDGLIKTFEMLLNEGDSILVEDPSYSGAFAALRPMGVEIVGVETDHEGLIPQALNNVLSQWPMTHPNSPLPKALYTIPTGQNPSGSTLSNERKKQIYSIAQKYNFIIIEDDPYWFMQFEHSVSTSSSSLNNLNVENRRSFLSMDVDGRVVRLDSFSKVLSAGIRLGYATGPTPLIERLEMHQQATNLHASGLSQMLVFKLLSMWGIDGFKKHIAKVQQFYRQQRDFMLDAAIQHLTGLADWTTPSAGMFMWIRLHGVEDTDTFIQQTARNVKVLLVPGKAFSPNNKPSPYVRASFSLASQKDIDEAFRRLSTLLRELQSNGPQSQ